jgi:hypothetical protein
VLDILHRARQQIIHAEHFMAFRQEALAEVRSNETRAARDDRFQSTTPWSIQRDRHIEP